MNSNFLNYLDSQNRANSSLPASELERLLIRLREARNAGATVWIAGNGGSAATASHAVADFVKTSNQMGRAPVKSLALHESVSLVTAISNDIEFRETFSKSLEWLSKPGDLYLAISVSGTSPNLVAGKSMADHLGLDSACIFGKKGEDSSKDYAHAIVIESDDYQIVENTHMFIIHWLVKELQNQ